MTRNTHESCVVHELVKSDLVGSWLRWIRYSWVSVWMGRGRMVLDGPLHYRQHLHFFYFNTTRI